jgi:NAD(P)-dependent dehydrogenase (short-subunit alcohol dehydrogenase family)
VTDGLRIQLKAQGTHVIGVYAGFIDTDMGTALSSGPKTSPQQVARKTVQGIRAGIDYVLADERAESTWQAVRQDPAKLHAEMQARWDQHTASMTTKA